MTSSLKNSIHRRNHKERSQLAHRTRLGILEKHKDYVQRAKDYHSKQDRLNRLRQKAADRNKDEFYFSMVNEKSKGGVHLKDRGNVALPVDIVKVLKTQDENYVRTMRASNAKKIDKLKTQLATMADLVKSTSVEDGEGELEEDELKILRESGILRVSTKKHKAHHIIFAESADEARQFAKQSRSKSSSTEGTIATDSKQPSEVDLGWKSDQPKHKRRKSHTQKLKVSHDSEDLELDDLDVEVGGSRSTGSTKQRLLKELSARLHRDKQLRYAQREFEMQRLLMGKGARTKIAGVERTSGNSESEEDEDEIDARKGRRRNSIKKVNEATYKPRVYKWKMERKR